MQQPVEKLYTDLRAGYITETGFLNSVDGSTTDEENVRLEIDGSRRRRRGLALEAGGSRSSMDKTMAADHVCSEGEWRNAGGDADKDFIVVQIGRWLKIYENTGDTLSTNLLQNISLAPFTINGTDAEAEDYPCSFASGAGVLIVCGRYLTPFYVEYNSTTGAFTTETIQILERDFHTIPEGGVRYNTEPGSLSTIHEYNLRNRGWKDADITAYQSGQSKYPALGMHWYKGYARAVDGVAYINEDGVKAFNHAKMAAEPFGNASAPTGSLLIDPFDTTSGYQTAPGTFDVGNWTVSDPSPTTWAETGTWEITFTVTGHGLTNPTDTITLSGQSSKYTFNEGKYTGESPDIDLENVPWSMDGEHTTTYVDADTFTIDLVDWDRPHYWNGWDDQYENKGSIATGDPLVNDEDSYTTDERPTVCGWFAGRAWFGGIKHPQLVDRVYFSRLIQPMHREFGECFQRNDPTDEVFNALLPDDGGVIVIADIGNLKGMLDYNGSHLLFSDAGVWEVRGSRGVFTADNYQVRKLSDEECTGKQCIARTEGSVMYSGTKGIFQIQPDPRTGILYATNISAPRVQTEWNSIPQSRQERCKTAYDDANKQVYFLYSKDTGTFVYLYDTALVYDLRLQAFYKLTWNGDSDNCIIGMVPIKDADESGTYKKIKFLCQTDTGTNLKICDHENSGYTDFDGNEKIPYMHMAYENVGNWTRKGHAPYVHVFMGKTETGYDSSLNPENESSIMMQSRWDWSDNVNSGEYGQAYQVYRHTRAYTPASAADTFDTGYPVIVTRNKVRGRGRGLYLRFYGEAGKDFHLLGYGVLHKVNRRV